MSLAHASTGTEVPHQAPPPYSFLAQPPPQKKRPTQTLPSPPPPPSLPPSPPRSLPRQSRKRSSTVSAIASWAQHVQPGSPAPRSPRSPRHVRGRRPSITITTTSRGRRPSVTSIRLTTSGGSFLNILDTPSTGRRTTPSIKDFNNAVDLTTVGYTSVFVRLPNAPFSATLPNKTKPMTPTTPNTNAYAHIPIPPIPQSPTKTTLTTLKRFRSLSLLRSRPRSKSTATTPSPPKSPSPSKSNMTPPPKSKPTQKNPKTKPTKTKPSSAAVTIAKHKKAKYAHLRPPPLANDLALMQFADGGSMESHIKRVMEAQAKAVGGNGGGVGGGGVGGGVGDVYRDGQGGIWWDAEEEWEYAHLLGGEERVGSGEGEDWVLFAGGEGAAGGDGEVRRGSVSTVSTQDSDLLQVEPVNVVDDLATYGGALTPLGLCRRRVSVLTIAAGKENVMKQRERERRMRRSGCLLDLDVVFPVSPSPLPSSSLLLTTTLQTKPKQKSNPKGPARRRRPAPLTLSPPSPALKRATNSPGEPLDADKIRRDFIDDSFVPAASSSPSRARTPRGRETQTRKTSKDSSSSGATITTRVATRRAVVVKKASVVGVRALAFFRGSSS